MWCRCGCGNREFTVASEHNQDEIRVRLDKKTKQITTAKVKDVRVVNESTGKVEADEQKAEEDIKGQVWLPKRLPGFLQLIHGNEWKTCQDRGSDQDAWDNLPSDTKATLMASEQFNNRLCAYSILAA